MQNYHEKVYVFDVFGFCWESNKIYIQVASIHFIM